MDAIPAPRSVKLETKNHYLSFLNFTSDAEKLGKVGGFAHLSTLVKQSRAGTGPGSMGRGSGLFAPAENGENQEAQYPEVEECRGESGSGGLSGVSDKNLATVTMGLRFAAVYSAHRGIVEEHTGVDYESMKENLFPPSYMSTDSGRPLRAEDFRIR